MRITSTLRFLSVPAAVALAAALAVACSDGAPTAPDQVGQPDFKKKAGGNSNHVRDDYDGGCTYWGNGWTLTTVNPGTGADADGDGQVCKYHKV